MESLKKISWQDPFLSEERGFLSAGQNEVASRVCFHIKVEQSLDTPSLLAFMILVFFYLRILHHFFGEVGGGEGEIRRTLFMLGAINPHILKLHDFWVSPWMIDILGRFCFTQSIRRKSLLFTNCTAVLQWNITQPQLQEAAVICDNHTKL